MYSIWKKVLKLYNTHLLCCREYFFEIKMSFNIRYVFLEMFPSHARFKENIILILLTYILCLKRKIFEKICVEWIIFKAINLEYDSCKLE